MVSVRRPDDRAVPGDSVILDASPIFDDLLVDTSTSFVHEPSDGAHGLAAAADLAYRQTILDAVRGGATFLEIAGSVDADLAAAGYRNCHRLHPGEVLGHRVGEVGDVAEADNLGFAHQLVAWFFAQIARVPVQTPAPTWSANAGSDHQPADGLWAVEPHLGRGDIGVKWEEILVIQGSEAYWLEDSPPHVLAAR